MENYNLKDDDLCLEVMNKIKDDEKNNLFFLEYALGLDTAIRKGKSIDKLRLLYETIDHDSDNIITLMEFCSTMIYHIPRKKDKTMEGNMIEFYTRVKKYLPKINIENEDLLSFDNCYKLIKEMKVLDEIVINPYCLVQGLWRRDKKKIHMIIKSEVKKDEKEKERNFEEIKENNYEDIEDRLSESDFFE